MECDSCERNCSMRIETSCGISHGARLVQLSKHWIRALRLRWVMFVQKQSYELHCAELLDLLEGERMLGLAMGVEKPRTKPPRQQLLS